MAAPALAAPRQILFVGNSFTHAGPTPVKSFHPQSVTDLNGTGLGGVPALFKSFTRQLGLDYAVSLDTHGGSTLHHHLTNCREQLDRKWDAVILQEFSTLDRNDPGNPMAFRAAAHELASLFTAANSRVRVHLMATWSRADLTYHMPSPWKGQPITAMAEDLQQAANMVRDTSADIDSVLPVGAAWNRAMAEGVADSNPYDGLDPGRINLWASDHYHASIHGYYLEALVVLARVTGRDPQRLGPREEAAAELGIPPEIAIALQRIACLEVQGKNACRNRRKPRS